MKRYGLFSVAAMIRRKAGRGPDRKSSCHPSARAQGKLVQSLAELAPLITIAAIVLTALAAWGCKKPAPPAPVDTTTNDAPVITNAAPVNPATSRIKDLGVVQLTNRCETRVELGDGKSCTFKALLTDTQHLKLTLTLETKLADGKTRGLKVLSVVTRPAEPLQVDFGSVAVTLTPQVVLP
jgi:hypothetical protein